MLMRAVLLVVVGVLFFGAVSFGAVSSAQQTEPRWYDDLEAARKVAIAEKKHLLVDFTGTGWCAWCKRLDDEVLSRENFVDRASDAYVLVRLDYGARGLARRDRPHSERNDKFREAVGVDVFPTVLLMTTDGVPYAQAGYREGGASRYVDWTLMEHARAVALQRTVPGVVAAVTGAKTPEEARGASGDAAKVLRDAGPHVLAKSLVPIVQTILKEEELGEERERLAVEALVAAEVVDDDVVERSFLLDPRNKSGLLEGALAGAMKHVEGPERASVLIGKAEMLLRTSSVHDAQRAARLYADCARWCKQTLDQPDRSRAFARFALSLHPEDPRLRVMLEDLSGD